jgi:serine/threonine-protein kinase HipA
VGNAPPLSTSLPLRRGAFTPVRSAPFFEGLLPEGNVRTSIARKFGLSEADGFGLLAALGADCAGAVVVLPEGEFPCSESEEIRELGDEDLRALVDELPRRPLGVTSEPDGVRLSLGGVQDKLVLARTESGRLALPTGGAPSTCLLKPDYGRYEDLAVNERFCMSVAGGARLEAAPTELIGIGPTPCLLVERFDRAVDDQGNVARLHQEDMCQALGLLPAAKYEENGGPSVAAIVALLRGLGARAALDINAFCKALVLDFLLGNSDAHGKNFALFYRPEDAIRARLAPLYDIVSTAVYPDLTGRLAMRIGGVDDPDEVDLPAWGRLGAESGLGGQLTSFVQAWAAEMLSAAERCRRDAIAAGWHRPVIDAIVEVCRRRACRLIEARY